MSKNYEHLIYSKQLQIQDEKDPKKKQFLYRQLRVLEYQKQIEDIHKKMDDLNQLNKAYGQ
jgi:hypothetical protein